MRILDTICINTRKIINKYTAHKYPETSGGWKKFQHNPIIGDNNTGSLFDPFVLKQDNKFIMYLSSRNKNGIVRYESIDGKKWENSHLVLLSNEKDISINRASIVISPNGIWHIYYTAQKNGKSWIEKADSPNGFLFDSKDAIKCVGGYDDEICYMNPCVIWDKEDNIYKMWYSAGEFYEPDVIMYATSEDNIHWNTVENVVLMKEKREKYRKKKVGGCQVIKLNNSNYCMFYIGYQNIDVANICLAYSHDGINWVQDSSNPVISPSMDGWDSDSVYKPTVVLDKELKYLWYNGRKNKNEYIGFAIKEERNQ